MTAELLFTLRNSEPLRVLRAEYFSCQNQASIDELFAIICEFRGNTALRKLLKHSPVAAVAFLFEALDRAHIGSRAINKGMEHLLKATLGDSFDECFAKRCYNISSHWGQLEKEVKRLTRAAGVR